MCLVLGCENFIRKIVECVMSLRGTLFGAEDQSHRRVLVGLHPLLASIIEVHMCLPSVCVAEHTNLQVRDD
jgi:hypothetical protein